MDDAILFWYLPIGKRREGLMKRWKVLIPWVDGLNILDLMGTCVVFHFILYTWILLLVWQRIILLAHKDKPIRAKSGTIRIRGRKWGTNVRYIVLFVDENAIDYVGFMVGKECQLWEKFLILNLITKILIELQISLYILSV
jgi:hypothetical protein